MHRLFFIVSAVAAAIFCGQALAQDRPAPAQVTRDIEDLAQKQAQFLRQKDAAALAGLFTADAVYATASGEVFKGRSEIERYYGRVIPGLGASFNRSNTVDEVHTLGDFAWALGHGTTTVRTEIGVADLNDHWLALYALVDGKWLVKALNLGENVSLLPTKR